ncbi:MAG: DUF805 domain-containing protein [Roseobacter sp.]
MTFRQAVATCLRKYFTFSGRASRSEYWWFVLFCALGGIILGILDEQFFGVDTFVAEATETSARVAAEFNGPLAGIFSLATFIPLLAAGWRRMHDSGRTGFHLLYPLIAMIGLSTFVGLVGGFEQLTANGTASLFQGVFGLIIALAFIVIIISPFIVLWWLIRPSQPGQNQYGPNPHEVLQ